MDQTVENSFCINKSKAFLESEFFDFLRQSKSFMTEFQLDNKSLRCCECFLIFQAGNPRERNDIISIFKENFNSFIV